MQQRIILLDLPFSDSVQIIYVYSRLSSQGWLPYRTSSGKIMYDRIRVTLCELFPENNVPVVSKKTHSSSTLYRNKINDQAIWSFTSHITYQTRVLSPKYIKTLLNRLLDSLVV